MTRKRIMVVEDEGITAMNIKSELEDMGYDVPSIAISGEEALEIAGQNNIDLVLMDIMLSGKIDGVEASGRIRSMLQIPIVYITANTDEKIMEQIKLTEPYG
jgi:CheY-like chemotaxis protein